MAANIFLNTILFVLFLYPLVNATKKYDMQTESLRLYGENFDSVLDRFRRTPAYLSIIKEKYKDMMINVHSIATPITQYIEKEINARVADIVGYTTFNDSETVRSKPFRWYKSTKQTSDANSTVDPIQLLDGYELLHQLTNINERNQFKDIGFEMAQHMVHAVIRAMGPVDGTTATFEEKGWSKVPSGHSGDILSTKARRGTDKIMKDKLKKSKNPSTKNNGKRQKKN